MSAGKLYEVRVEPPGPNSGDFCFLSFHKSTGNCSGGGRSAKSKAEALTEIRRRMKDWEEFDSILQRYVDKPTRKNTRFESFTDELREPEIFGGSTLFNFVGR